MSIYPHQISLILEVESDILSLATRPASSVALVVEIHAYTCQNLHIAYYFHCAIMLSRWDISAGDIVAAAEKQVVSYQEKYRIKSRYILCMQCSMHYACKICTDEVI